MSDSAFPKSESVHSVPRGCHSRVRTPTTPAKNHRKSEEWTASNLCKRCQEIDFTALANQYAFNSKFFSHFVTNLSRLQHDDSCAACRLFEQISPLGLKHQLRLVSATNLFGTTKTTTPQVHVLGLAVVGATDNHSDESIRRAFVENGLALINIVGSSSSNTMMPDPALEVSAVSASVVDYDRCKAWIKCCGGFHGPSCDPKYKYRALMDALTCIDCITHEIGPIGAQDDYIALSYVWGTSNRSDFHLQHGYVPAKATQVILDAMKVVTELGKRYLWVDKYCIDQQNHDVKSEQIAEMDLVYAGAYATIIAAAGSNANYGLPGVSRPRSYVQHSLTVGNIEMTSTLPSLSHAIKSTTWSTRGWTYQEAVLSRRCIFFTEYQTYFMCRQMNGAEVVALNFLSSRHDIIGISMDTMGAINANMFGDDLGYPKLSILRDFTKHVTEYSRKALTYETDSLNAFRGLLARTPLFSHYGIPIDSIWGRKSYHVDGDYAAAFAVGLWWTSPYFTTRKHLFPSWTWVEWRGTIQYCKVLGDILQNTKPASFEDVERSHFDTQFLLEDFQGGVSSEIGEAVMICLGSSILPEELNILVIESTIISIQFEMRSEAAGSTARFKARDPQSSSDGANAYQEASGHAVFFEEFNHKRKWTRFWDCVFLFEDTSGLQAFMILDWDGEFAHRVGNLQLHRDEAQKIPNCRKRIRMV